VSFVKHALTRQASRDRITARLAPVAAILPAPAEDATASPPADLSWNWHFQNTDIVQGNPGFPTQYSGPNSLPSGGETRETFSADLAAGVRLWPGAAAFIDGLMWQGYGFENTVGVEGFLNPAFNQARGPVSVFDARVHWEF